MRYDNDESFFLQVARELSNNQKDEGLWLKAYALENGDDAKAKAHYVRLRVEKLKELRDLEGQESPETKADNLQSGAPKNAVKITPTCKADSSAASICARLWARNIDFLICMALYLVLTTASLASIDNLFLIFLVAFTVPGAVLVLYDAILISSFGQTIGKSFFGIRVLDDESNKLSFRVSLKRAIKAWAHGNACYFFFPVVTFIAWWQARRTIMAEGISPWDLSSGSSVTQSDIGALRNILAIFVGIINPAIK